MAQFARPDVVLDAGSWTGVVGNISESVANDATYIESPSAPVDTQIFKVSLSDVSDPISSANHVVRYRYLKSAAGGAQIDVKVDLRQGSVLVATSDWITNIAETVAAGTFTLSGGEADAITDYTDLQLWVYARQV
jgi:hypothetical protein